MAVSVATLTSGADLVPAGVSSTTASISPAADHPILAAVLCDKVGGALAAPTLTGNGITWTNVASVTYNTLTTPISRLSVFRGSSGAPTTGVITITHASTPTAVIWWVVDESGGPGSALSAVIQSATNRLDTATSITATLAAFQRAQHGALAFTAVVSGITPTAGSGWTDLGTQSTRLQAEWRADNDTTADSTFIASNAAIIAVELAAAYTLDPVGNDQPLQDLTPTRVLDPVGNDQPLQDLTPTRVLDPVGNDQPLQDLTPTRILFPSAEFPYSQLTRDSFLNYASTSLTTSTYSLSVDTPLSYSSTSLSTSTYTLIYRIDISYSSTSTSTDTYSLTQDVSLGYSSTSLTTSTYVLIAAVPINLSYTSTSQSSINYIMVVDNPPAPSSPTGGFRRFLDLGPRVQPPPRSHIKILT